MKSTNPYRHQSAIGIRLPMDLKAAASDYAVATDQNLSQIIRISLRRFLVEKLDQQRSAAGQWLRQ